jgi:histidinol dehydrogenase
MLQAGTSAEALSFAEAWAPEHLLLAVENPEAMLPLVRNAGTVFLGEGASVAFGDYLTGANHVLPTSGSARSYSGLSTIDFMRWTTYQRVSRAAASAMADATATLADIEGLPAHAAAARAWQVKEVQ